MRFFLSLMLGLALIVSGASNTMAQVSNTLSIVSKNGAVHNFSVELALTAQQQAQGLMNRTSMAADHGMLFIFGSEAERGFWMKNTLIPLDMIFIKRNGIIHHIHENAQPHDLTTAYSKGPVMAVLELNGGTAARLGLKPGDSVKHVVFSD